MIAESPSRIPPHNLPAERAILGCILLEGARALDHVPLEVTEFYADAHRAIYAAMRALAERSQTVSVLTLETELRELGQLGVAGGPAHLALCVTEASIEVGLASYVAIVRREAARREAIQACTQAVADLYGSNGQKPARPVLEVSQRLADQLTRLAAQADPAARAVPIGDVIAEVAAFLDAPTERRAMVPTPIPTLSDRMGGGLLPGEIVYLGGRPGTSKTAMALQWANLAAQTGHRTLLVSREMRTLALGRRYLAQHLRIPASSLRKADLWPHERARLEAARPRIAAIPLWFADQAVTIQQVRRLTRMLAPRFLVVDYVQLVESPADARAGKRLEVTAVSRGLKRLAMQLGCTVLALSSLRRLGAGEGRGRKKVPPSLDDLKESGDLEADADVVLLLWQRDEAGRDRQMTFAKIRDGKAGDTIELDWDPVFVQFNQLPGQGDAATTREPGDDVPF